MAIASIDIVDISDDYRYLLMMIPVGDSYYFLVTLIKINYPLFNFPVEQNLRPVSNEKFPA